MSILRCKVVFDQNFLRQPNPTLPPMNSVNNFHVQYPLLEKIDKNL